MPVRWWDEEPGEIFWMEITDRADFGTDLNAPELTERGRDYWSYRLLREVREGDVVLHYRERPIHAIAAWSRATGEPYRDQVCWGAHGQASGRGPVAPYWRPGWRRPLDGPYPLREPVSAASLDSVRADVVRVLGEVQAAHAGHSMYFPFVEYGGRELRAFQGYLTKVPRALMELVPELATVAELAGETRPQASAPAPAAGRPALGAEYRPANPDARTAQRKPFSVDPDLVDRALQAHACTQELLADALRAAGRVPRSPVPGEPVFDLAWDDDGTICVAEVKSLSGTNDEKQLRLALGQVLRYAHLLRGKGRPVRCFIAAESKPADDTWIELCSELGVTLFWPEEFAKAINGNGAILAHDN
jgi:hypothetical protein